MHTYGGLKIVLVEKRPRYVLPAEITPGVPWPAGFRAEINAWSVRELGFEAPLVPDGSYLVDYSKGAVYMNRDALETLIEQARATCKPPQVQKLSTGFA